MAVSLSWCQQWLGTVNKGNYSSFCRWRTYVLSLYKIYGYILGVCGRCDWDSAHSKSVRLTRSLIQWFSPESYSQSINNRSKVLRTHIFSKHPGCFPISLYHNSFWCFPFSRPCYALVVMRNRRNQVMFLMFIQTFKERFFGLPKTPAY